MRGLLQLRALTTALLAVVLLGRMLVPAGWMPVQASGEGFAIVLCSGDGPVQAWIDGAGKLHKGKHSDGKSGGEPKDPCPFGALTAPLNLVAPLEVATLAPLEGLSAIPAPDTTAIGHGLAAPPPPATGPPFLI
jgi:hypothetical protein